MARRMKLKGEWTWPLTVEAVTALPIPEMTDEQKRHLYLMERDLGRHEREVIDRAIPEDAAQRAVGALFAQHINSRSAIRPSGPSLGTRVRTPSSFREVDLSGRDDEIFTWGPAIPRRRDNQDSRLVQVNTSRVTVHRFP